MRPALHLAALTSSLCTLCAGPAFAEPRIGTAVRVVNQVTADQKAIVTGDGVNQNETVEVAPASLGEFKLDDDTKLALGPGARLTLDRFVFNREQSSGDVAVSLVKGAFRFITGAAQKRDYKIRTPNAAISVRGTVFDIYIADNGAEYLLLHQGAIEVCKGDGSDRATCRVLLNPCNVIRVSPAGTVSRPTGWKNRETELAVTFSEAFPFVITPPEIDPVVYNTRANIEANTCARPRGTPGIDRAEFESPGVPDVPLIAAEPAPPAIAGYEPRAADPVGRSGPPYSNRPGTEQVEGTQTGELVSSWTGLYVGLHGGASTADRDVEVECRDERRGLRVEACSPDGSSLPSGRTERYSLGGTDPLGGVQAGGLVQMGMLVVGLEGDITRTGQSSGIETGGGAREFYFDYSVAHRMDWFGTLRGRVGLAFGNVLIYGTGGLAAGDVETSFVLDDPGFGALARRSVTDIATGWTGGGGFEIGFGPVSFKTEYLYYDLGSERFEAEVTDTGGATPVRSGVYFAPDIDTRGHIARFGINLRLN